MNTLIANQYGRVQGEAGRCGLTLCVTAQTPRRESVELQTRVDSVEQQLHLLAILRAVERRIEQFQLREGKHPNLQSNRVLSMRPSAMKAISSLRTALLRKTKSMVAFPSSLSMSSWIKAGSEFSLPPATRPSAWLVSTSTLARFRLCML